DTVVSQLGDIDFGRPGNFAVRLPAGAVQPEGRAHAATARDLHTGLKVAVFERRFRTDHPGLIRGPLAAVAGHLSGREDQRLAGHHVILVFAIPLLLVVQEIEFAVVVDEAGPPLPSIKPRLVKLIGEDLYITGRDMTA